MKQSFSKKQINDFKKYFKIKEKESKIEKQFYKKTEKYLKYIKWIPWILMIWVWNSISMNTATKKSDIDLYIVTKQNRLWFVRILISFIFQILWVRKTAKKHAGRFCLSFFSTKKWMDFSQFALKNDIYLYFWIIYFKPILNYDKTYENFIQINSKWANFSDYKDIFIKNKKYIKYKKNIKKWKCKILDFFENIFKKFFLRKTIKNYKKLWKPFGIIINDEILKFHNKDVRKKIIKNLKI